MACIGLGVDVVDLERFSRIAEKWGSRFTERMFTSTERNYCERKACRIESYAASFAAKEAFLKAIGIGLRRGLHWKELEVRHDRYGRPCLRITGKARSIMEGCGAGKCHVRLGPTPSGAVAVVLLEGESSSTSPFSG